MTDTEINEKSVGILKYLVNIKNNVPTQKSTAQKIAFDLSMTNAAISVWIDELESKYYIVQLWDPMTGTTYDIKPAGIKYLMSKGVEV